MPSVYPNAVKITRMQAVITAAGSTAVLEIGTAGMATVLATIPLNNPIAPTPTGAGVVTLAGFPKTDPAADATGTAAAARIRTAPGGTDVVTGWTVGTSGADVIVASTAFVAGEPFTLTSATLTHAA